MIWVLWLACREPELVPENASPQPVAEPEPLSLPEPRVLRSIPWPREGWPEPDVKAVLELVQAKVPAAAGVALQQPGGIYFDTPPDRWPMWHVLEPGEPTPGHWRLWWRLSRDRWLGAEVEPDQGKVKVTYLGNTKGRPDWIRDPEELNEQLGGDASRIRAWLTDPAPWRRAAAVHALGWNESADKDALLLSATSDADPLVRAAAFDALHVWEPGKSPSPAWREAVAAALVGTSSVRAHALSFVPSSNDPALLRAAAELTCDPDDATRRAAVVAVASFFDEARLTPLLDDPPIAWTVKSAWENTTSGSLPQDLAEWHARLKQRTVLLFHPDALLEEAANRPPDIGLRRYLSEDRRADIELYRSRCGTPLGIAAQARAKEHDMAVPDCAGEADLLAAVQSVPPCTRTFGLRYDLKLWSPALSAHDVLLTLEDAAGSPVGSAHWDSSPTWVRRASIEATAPAHHVRLAAGGTTDVRPLPAGDWALVAGLCTVSAARPPSGVTKEGWAGVAHVIYTSDPSCIDAVVQALPAVPVPLAGDLLGLLAPEQLPIPLADLFDRAATEELAPVVRDMFTSRNGTGPCRPFLDVLTRTHRLQEPWATPWLERCAEDPVVYGQLVDAAESAALDPSVLAPAPETLPQDLRERGAEVQRARIMSDLLSTDPAIAARGFEALALLDSVRLDHRFTELPLGGGRTALGIEHGCEGEGDGTFHLVDGVLVLERQPQRARRVLVVDAPVHLVVCGTQTLWKRR